jgi:hypothetical protein
MVPRHDTSMPASTWEQPVQFLLIATWFALIAGFAELLFRGVQKFVL